MRHLLARGAWLVATCAALGPTLFSAPARAQATAPAAPSPDDPAALAKANGDKLMLSGQPALALAAYAEAYALRKDPALLYNRGRAYEALGDYPAALDQLEAFEKDATPELRARVPGLPQLLSDVRRRVSNLTIVCDVPGATVRIRDRTLGVTPMPQLRLVAGQATLEITKDGYFPVTRTLELPGAGVAQVDIKLASKATSAPVRIGSPVGGARVRIDGELRGNVPVEIMLPAGSHRVELDHAGYEPVQSSFVVTAGEPKTLDFPLQRSFSLTREWWFWTGLGVVVVGAGVGSYVALTTEKDPGSGTLGSPGRIQLPSFRF